MSAQDQDTAKSMVELAIEAMLRHQNKEGISVRILSGELDPIEWAKAEGAMCPLLQSGATFGFLFGPMILVDEKGQNPILSLAEEYGGQVRLFASTMRCPNHHFSLVVADTVEEIVWEFPHVPGEVGRVRFSASRMLDENLVRGPWTVQDFEMRGDLWKETTPESIRSHNIPITREEWKKLCAQSSYFSDPQFGPYHQRLVTREDLEQLRKAIV